MNGTAHRRGSWGDLCSNQTEHRKLSSSTLLVGNGDIVANDDLLELTSAVCSITDALYSLKDVFSKSSDFKGLSNDHCFTSYMFSLRV